MKMKMNYLHFMKVYTFSKLEYFNKRYMRYIFKESLGVVFNYYAKRRQ